MSGLDHLMSTYNASYMSSCICACKVHRQHEYTPPTPPQEPEDLCQSPPSGATISPPSHTPSSTAVRTPAASSILSNGLHVLNTASLALSNLSDFYSNSAMTQEAFTRAVRTIVAGEERGNKIVICGMGKSGRIGEKLVATFNSLGFTAVFLHPSEALHGDLGIVKDNDTVLLLTYSGATSELYSVLPHFPPTCPRILLTKHTDISTCPLPTFDRPLPKRMHRQPRHVPRSPTPPPEAAEYILLPTPIPGSEMASFGVPAPTTSITVALTVGHALAVAAAKEYYAVEEELEEDVEDQEDVNDDMDIEVQVLDAEQEIESIEGQTQDLRDLLDEVARQKRRGRGTVADVFARNHPGGALGAAAAGR